MIICPIVSPPQFKGGPRVKVRVKADLSQVLTKPSEDDSIGPRGTSDNRPTRVEVGIALYCAFFVRVVTYRSSMPTPSGRSETMKSVSRSAAM